MPTSFTVNRSDLEFMLKQIQIAEVHAGGTPLSQAIQAAFGVSAADAALLPAGLRTVDGSYNNLLSEANKDFGAADTMFPRLTTPVWRNEGDEAPFFGVGNTDYFAAGSVVDSDPRIISNLIVDMSITNPAAVEAYFNNPLSLDQFAEDHPGFTPVRPGVLPGVDEMVVTTADLQSIPNQSPDIGLSPGFNAWMTFFGQFFDHGLDLVTKGGNGTVFVPLQPDDPLITHGPDGVEGNGDEVTDPSLQFMALTRATPFDPDGAGPLPAVPREHENTTTSWVDQNQTYTSHSSHQVFLREYVRDGGQTFATGRLLDGSAVTGSVDRAIGNWAEVKAQALEMLGIVLEDTDALNVPLLRTDEYGRFIPAANGYAQIATDSGFVDGTLAGTALPADTIRTNHKFLDNVAHNAVPGTLFDLDGPGGADPEQVQPDADEVAGNAIAVDSMGRKVAYDDELLDLHFATGDGRGNENIALTTVHSIFHSEHNRLVDANKATILETGDVDFINEWLRVDVVSPPVTTEEIDALQWDGERLFQAARFATEMQYQHLVFEEFARRIQPMVDPFIFNNTPEVDASIVAEFAHTVYRFGHSMLTGTVDRLENDLTAIGSGNPDQHTLLAVFLNPQQYLGSGADLEEVNANIIRGLSRNVGNSMDEFIVNNVRTNLLGLPLDLAVLNLSRGRETGIPSLNQTREQLYNDTGLSDLAPYTSWADFSLNMKNAASIVNFIAAYGTHDSITLATTLADKRAAAEELVFGVDGSDADGTVPGDRVAFLNATGPYAGGNLGGLNDVDLWIGGLAEKNPEFGGMLGTTFNYVFEKQMEDLQFGDRMYYLTRTQGLNFLNQLEPNTFADLVMRNTALGSIYSTHLNGSLFTTPDYIIELDRGIAQTDYNGADPGNDPVWQNPFLGDKVVRDYTGSTVVNVDGVDHDEGGYLRVLGGEHYVLGGTEGADRMYGDSGIDTLWGDGGNDYLNGMTESDDVFGGEGDDVIEDPFGDDVLRGMQGNDVISDARGANLLFGGEGIDYIIMGQDAAETFGGSGNDFILGGQGKDFILGNDGDDWMEGGQGFDTLAGENSELFFNSSIIGHDVMFGQGDETDYDSESGDDIMGSGPSVFRYEGMFGFDWGIAKADTAGVNFDMQIPIFSSDPANVLRDRFDMVEALSGWKYGNVLDGDDRGSPLIDLPLNDPGNFVHHVLTQEGIDRIAGLNAWLAGARATLGLGTDFRDGNILIGGDGDDAIQGRGGNDLIDGDAWLNVRISIDMGDDVVYYAESMSTSTAAMGPLAGKVTNAEGVVQFLGRSLNSLMLDRTLTPGQLSIVREIKYDDTDVTFPGANIDTAIYRGGYAEYDIEGRVTSLPDGGGTVLVAAFDVNGDGFITVHDRDNGVTGATVGGVTLPTRGILTDGTDLLKSVEYLQFADQTIQIGGFIVSASPTDIRWGGVTPASVQLPLIGQTIANLSTVDPDTLSGFSYVLQPGSSPGFAVSAGGAVSPTGANMAEVTISTLTVRSNDGTGAFFDETFTVRTGSGFADALIGDGTDNIMYGVGGSDILNGAAGNDTLFGQAGSDNLSGGAGNDVLNGGSGTDTASYAGAAGGVTVSLAIATQQNTFGAGLDTLLSMENFTGSSLNDTLTGSAGANVLNGGDGVDTLNGGAGADLLVGGGGADTIDTGASNDNVQDRIRFAATTEFGDTVANFDADGTAATDDRIEFASALNAAYDDGNSNDNFLFAAGNGGVGTSSVDIGQGDADIEALLLTGAGGEGVTTADLGNAGLVAAAFNTEFNFTDDADGRDVLLVINDTDAGSNSFSVWQWIQAGGNLTEIDAAELALIGIFTGNATVTADNFDFV